MSHFYDSKPRLIGQNSMSLIRKAFFGALVGVLAFFIFTRNSEQEKSELNIEMGSLGKALIVGWTGLVILVNRRNRAISERPS